MLDLLTRRTSCGKLTAPSPQGEALNAILHAGLRAPDHGRLQPWRFITIENDGLNRLGELFFEAAKRRLPEQNEAALEKFRQQPQRAPLIIVVVASPKKHMSIPAIEQEYSAAAATYAMLLAANAQGFSGIWRTGDNAYDPYIKQGLGIQDHEQIIAYLYLGTAAGAENPLPSVELNKFVTQF